MLSHHKEQLLLHKIFTVVWVLTAKLFVNVICFIQWRNKLSNSLFVTLACKKANDFKASNIFSRFLFNDLNNSLMPIDASIFHDINTFICSAKLSSTDFTSNNVLTKFELRCNEEHLVYCSRRLLNMSHSFATDVYVDLKVLFFQMCTSDRNFLA